MLQSDITQANVRRTFVSSTRYTHTHTHTDLIAASNYWKASSSEQGQSLLNGARKLTDTPCGQSKTALPKSNIPEQQVQQQWMDKLLELMKNTGVSALDYSNKLLERHKPDILLSCDPNPTSFTPVVSVIELKSCLDLSGTGSQSNLPTLGKRGLEALGQVAKRFEAILRHQPSRQYMTFLLGDADCFVVGRLTTPEQASSSSQCNSTLPPPPYSLQLAPGIFTFGQCMYATCDDTKDQQQVFAHPRKCRT
jgi:hypothetical protein